jgi:hypothetical protein
MTWGKPNRQMIFFHINFSTAWEVMDAKASASTHLINYSIATRINLRCRVAIGKGPKMSIPQRSNGQAPAIVIISTDGKWVNLLLTWHFLHRRTNDVAS